MKQKYVSMVIIGYLCNVNKVYMEYSSTEFIAMELFLHDINCNILSTACKNSLCSRSLETKDKWSV